MLRYADDMELEDAVSTAIRTLKEGFEVRSCVLLLMMLILLQGQLNERNIEVAVVRADKLFRILTPDGVHDYLQELQ